jgi:SAM-dependent methyltransferase
MDAAREDWDKRYEAGNTPWDSGVPSQELIRVLQAGKIAPGRALDIGCGTGTNAIWLAQQGFDVTAFDLSARAIEAAKAKARAAGAKVHFHVADAFQPMPFAGTFAFVFDRGLYHIVRRIDLGKFQAFLASVCAPGGWFLVLTGNEDDPNKSDEGPPKVSAAQMLAELEPLFALQELRAFTFDGVVIQGKAVRPLAWSGLFRRRVSPM